MINEDQNIYAYTGNDPLNNIDPSGQIGLIGTGIGVVTGGISGYVAGGWKGGVAGAVVGGGGSGEAKSFSGVIASQYGPIAQGLITKYANGTISQAAPSTVVKMVGAETLEENVIPGTVAEDMLNNLANQSLPSFSIGGSATSTYGK